MKPRKQYQLDEVIRSLSKKHDVNIDTNLNTIEILTGKDAKHDLGNKSWGKIDFLCNYQGFHIMKVIKLSRQNYKKDEVQ